MADINRKNKQLNPREFAKILRNNGFRYDHTKGSHMIYYRGNDMIVLPSREANRMICRRLIKEFNLQF